MAEGLRALVAVAAWDQLRELLLLASSFATTLFCWLIWRSARRIARRVDPNEPIPGDDTSISSPEGGNPRRRDLDQPERLEAGMPVAPDNDVVVDDDPHRRRDLDDLAGHVDVRW